MNTEEILEERGGTHGRFKDNARITQALVQAVTRSQNYGSLDDVQREALHMIFGKIARIMSGNADYIENWRDICGYSELVAKELQKKNGALDSMVTYKTIKHANQ